MFLFILRFVDWILETKVETYTRTHCFVDWILMKGNWNLFFSGFLKKMSIILVGLDFFRRSVVIVSGGV